MRRASNCDNLAVAKNSYTLDSTNQSNYLTGIATNPPLPKHITEAIESKKRRRLNA